MGAASRRWITYTDTGKNQLIIFSKIGLIFIIDFVAIQKLFGLCVNKLLNNSGKSWHVWHSDIASWIFFTLSWRAKSSHPKVFLGKGVLKKCSKFTGEHPRRSVISIRLQSNFIEITLWHCGPPVNLLRIFRTPFPKNTSGGLLLKKV